MIRYFSGANQHHLNHTFGKEDEVIRAFSHAGELPYVIGCVASNAYCDAQETQQVAQDVWSFGTDILSHMDLNDVESSMEYDHVSAAISLAADIWTSFLDDRQAMNDYGEFLKLGVMLIRYQDNFGRNQWSFMVAVYHGMDWLQSEEDVVPLHLSITRLS